MKRIPRFLGLALAALPFLAAHAETWQETVQTHTRWTVRNLSYLQSQELAESPVNPENQLLLPSLTAQNDLRLDLDVYASVFDFALKPRFEIRQDWWDSGALDGESRSDSEAFVNEWLARVQLGEVFFLSYGREDLQWGPSFLLSPSNPFDSDNGRRNPKKEVPGADYGKLVWTPSQAWTASLIINTDPGRKAWESATFEETYALKVDFLRDRGYFSAIASYQDTTDARLGLVAHVDTSDALALYVEGSGDSSDVEALVGGSYTLMAGPTLVMELFHNQSGDADTPLAGLLAEPLPLATRESLLRQNYLLVQAYDQNITDNLSAVLRWVLNLDDNSTYLLGLAEYDIGAHTRLFATGNLNEGDGESEFGSILDYWIMGGVELIF